MDRESLVNRVRDVLVGLEFLSEARAATPPDKKAGAHQKPSDSAPSGIGRANELEFHYRSIENMVRAAERGLELAKRRARNQEENREQFAFRVLTDYLGSPLQFVADKERVPCSRVAAIRTEAKVNVSNGREPSQRGPKPKV